LIEVLVGVAAEKLVLLVNITEVWCLIDATSPHRPSVEVQHVFQP
jgi:hypothetical protein